MENFFTWLKYWIAKILEMFDNTQEWLDKLETTETTTL